MGPHPSPAFMPEPTPNTPAVAARVNPGVIAPAASALDSFNWPTPPFAAYPAGEPWSQPKACEVFGLNGVSRSCLLVALDPFDRIAHVQVPPSRVSMPLRFSQFQRIVIEEPLPAQEADADDPLLHHRPEVSYRLVLVDGHEEAGRTVGHIEVNYGLFLFKPVNAQGAVRREFLPRDAFLSIELGPRMTDMLLEQQVLSEQQLQQATQEHQALQSRKLGDLLVQQKLVSGDDLLMAVDQQSRMPMVRLGEALTALGLVSEPQMRAALAQQQSERDLSLGEVLIRSGRVSREALQLAQAQKLGFPAIDADSFPVDPLALARVPGAMARRLNALPLVLRDGRLLVAVEDPMRRSVIEELELVANAKVAPVLAVGERLARRITTLYPELASAEASPPTGPEAAASDPSDAPRPHLVATSATGDAAVLRELGRLLHRSVLAGVHAIHLDCRAEQVALFLRDKGGLVASEGFESLGSRRVWAGVQALLKGPDLRATATGDGSGSGSGSAPSGVVSGWLDVSVGPEWAASGLGGVWATLSAAPSAHAVLQMVWPRQPAHLAELGLPEPVHHALGEALAQRRGLVLLASTDEVAEQSLRESCAMHVQQTPAAPVAAGSGAALARKRWVWTHASAAGAAASAGAAALPWSAHAHQTAHAWLQLAAADADALVVADLCDAPHGGLLLQALLQIARRHALVVLSLPAGGVGQALERLLDLGLSAHDIADTLQLVVVAQRVPGLCAACNSPGPAQAQDLEALEALFLESMAHQAGDTAQALAAAKATWPKAHDGLVHVVRCAAPSTGCVATTEPTLYGMRRPNPAWRRLVREQADAQTLDQAGAGLPDSFPLAADGLTKALRGLADPHAVLRALRAG